MSDEAPDYRGLRWRGDGAWVDISVGKLTEMFARLDAAERERDRLYSLAKANNDLVRMMTTERRVLREALEGCLHFDDGFIRSGVIGDALKQWRWAAEAALTANHSAPVVEE